MRPYMCTPQPLQAWRWMVALLSTTASRCALEVTARFSRLTTATTENFAPAGFQHLVQPQAWLCATLPLMETVTGSLAQWQVSVPPLNFLAPAFTPLSIDGWSLMAMGIASLLSERNYGPDGFTLVHEIESVIDLFQRHHVGDEVVDVDLLVHVPVDDLRHVGAAACATESRALPHPPRHQLERACLDFLAGAGHTDDHRYAPAAVAAFQCLAHEIDVT